MSDEPIVAGKIAFVRISGEPVFVLAPAGPPKVEHCDWLVRRLRIGQNGGSYEQEFFSTGELVSTNPYPAPKTLADLFGGSDDPEDSPVTHFAAPAVEPALN